MGGRPQVHGRVGAPGPPALGVRGEVLLAVGQAQRRGLLAQHQVPDREGVRVPERAQGDVVRGPRPDPRQRQEPGPGGGAVDAPVQGDLPGGDRPGQRPDRRRPPASVIPRPPRSASARVSAEGNGTRCAASAPAGPSAGRKRPAIRPASVRAAATLTCWPTIARTAISNPSKQPGTRSPGRRATSGASAGSAASAGPIRSGSASRSSRSRQRRTATATSRRSSTASRACTARPSSRSSTVPVPCGSRIARR